MAWDHHSRHADYAIRKQMKHNFVHNLLVKHQKQILPAGVTYRMTALIPQNEDTYNKSFVQNLQVKIENQKLTSQRLVMQVIADSAICKTHKTNLSYYYCLCSRKSKHTSRR